MAKQQIVLYQLNSNDEIETVQGVVVNEGSEEKQAGGFWDGVWEFFYTQGANVGGNKRKPFNDNGREYDPETGSWIYTEAANGKADPFQCDYEAPHDFQGSVPVWDGYNG